MAALSNRQQHWQSHLDQLDVSGLSIKAYAERHNLKASTLYFYRKKLRSAPTPVAPTRFVRAQVTPTALRCRVHLTNGVVVELGSDPRELSDLLTTLSTLS